MTDSTQDPLRGTGRTTNRIITLVRTAIANPDLVLNCRDHYDSNSQHIYVTNKVSEILEILKVGYTRMNATSLKVIPMLTPEERTK